MISFAEIVAREIKFLEKRNAKLEKVASCADEVVLRNRHYDDSKSVCNLVTALSELYTK